MLSQLLQRLRNTVRRPAGKGRIAALERKAEEEAGPEEKVDASGSVILVPMSGPRRWNNHCPFRDEDGDHDECNLDGKPCSRAQYYTRETCPIVMHGSVTAMAESDEVLRRIRCRTMRNVKQTFRKS